MIETGYHPFLSAQPVWIAHREREMNLTVRFVAVINGANAVARLTASTLYRMFVNGKLAAYGPARGPKDVFRVDELDISQYLREGDNYIVVEVAGYNVNSYYTMEAPSFLQAEIVSGGKVTAHTAPDGEFVAEIVSERVQKVQRYSFQRTFAEAWRLSPDYTASFAALPAGGEPLAVQEPKALLPRRVSLPTLAYIPCDSVVGAGRLELSPEPVRSFRDRSLTAIGQNLHGYREDELEVRLTEDADHYSFAREDFQPRAAGAETVTAGRYLTYKFRDNNNGFLSLRVGCAEPTCLVAMFDELVQDGELDFRRMGDVCNIVRWELEPGEYELTTFECYSMQGVRLAATRGGARIASVGIVEYASSSAIRAYSGEDEELRKIWDAAVLTYRHNSVDIFMDCPSRERAGWLCDSFWTARAERTLTGSSEVERNFLENFLLAESYPHLPQGMLPMCYPADHNDGVYIPNWAMWLVLELREYYDRSGDRAMIDAFRARLDGLIAFLDGYLNGDGLLEKLPSWVFVEWSRANELVQDVNYPSNMLYARCLEAYGELYGDAVAIARAGEMRRVILAQSFDGEFFNDNALRGADGVLRLSGERTEVCQYYAFTFGVVSPESHPALWDVLKSAFGPKRREDNRYPDIHFANAFIGNYLRLDLLYRYGCTELVTENIRGYFTKMAEATGTLWEHDGNLASLDHGFASHVVCWLA